MTPPTVQFIPAPAAVGPDYAISGTFDGNSATAGAADNDPSAVPAITGLSTVIMRGTLGANQCQLVFDTSGNRDGFVTAIPNGSAAVITHLSTVYTAASFTWQIFGTVARVSGSNFDSLPASFGSGENYTLEFYA